MSRKKEKNIERKRERELMRSKEQRVGTVVGRECEYLDCNYTTSFVLNL